MVMSVFISVTIPVLTYLNSKCFLEKSVSLRNCVGMSRMTMILILIGLFGDICVDIGSSSFIGIWTLLTKLMRSRIKLFWAESLFLFSPFFTYPRSQLKKKKKTYKICARKKLNSLFMYVPLTLPK